MPAEYPPLGKFFVTSYANNDRDFPIIAVLRDPRNENYKIPEDLSSCPDKRYPNHVFTGAQPSSSDERVRLIYEILPAPWIPFTRYDDDLGPIQGRRRAVKNEGQQASLTASKRITYEGREGSAIVSIESEEAWNAGSGDPNDDESPFPIKERDFYDDRLGAVSETRQIFAARGDEKASLVYEDPKIIQTDYEIYNEYLVVKVVRSYVVPCPERIRDIYDPTLGSVQEVNQVILDTKDFEGSIVFNGNNNGIGVITETIYQPLNTLATERTIRTYSVPAPERRETVYDPVKGAISRVSRAIKDSGEESSLYVSGGVATETRRQPINSIVVDFIIETYSIGGIQSSAPALQGQQYEESLDVVFPYTQQAFSAPSLEFPIDRKEFQPVDEAHSVGKNYDFNVIASQLDDFYWECPDLASVNLPNILLRATLFLQISQGGDSGSGSGDTYYWKSSGSSSINGDLVYDIQQGYNGLVPAIRSVFFIEKNQSDITQNILLKLAKNGVVATVYPYVKTIDHTVTMTGGSQQGSRSESASISYDGEASGSRSEGFDFSVSTKSTNIPPTLHKNIPVNVAVNATDQGGGDIDLTGFPPFSLSVSSSSLNGVRTYTYPTSSPIVIPSTDPPTFPLGKYVTSINASPYRFGYTRVETIVIDITNIYTEEAKNTSSQSQVAALPPSQPIILLFPVEFSAIVGVQFKKIFNIMWAEDVLIDTSPYTWIDFDRSTKTLSGTPTQSGTFSFNITASNSLGSASSSTITITVT